MTKKWKTTEEHWRLLSPSQMAVFNDFMRSVEDYEDTKVLLGEKLDKLKLDTWRMGKMGVTWHQLSRMTGVSFGTLSAWARRYEEESERG